VTRVTFPHMGNIEIALKQFLEGLGHEVVLAPPNSNKTVNLGVLYSPEGICYPFKLVLGNWIEAISRGADLLIMAGGIGPCRFGMYAMLHRKILQELGSEAKMLVIEPPAAGWNRFFKNAVVVNNHTRLPKTIRECYRAWRTLRACCDVERAALHYRGRTTQPDRITEIYKSALGHISKSSSTTSLKDIVDVTCSIMAEVYNKNRRPANQVLEIGLIGEVYAVLEPFANLGIEERLGKMGAAIHRPMYADTWVRDNVFLAALSKRRINKQRAAVRKWLDQFVGGHGLENLYHLSKFSGAREAIDGIVHVYPFGCLPEIVASSIIPAMSKEKDQRVLTVILDEETADAGLQTRLEAFVDLLRSRKMYLARTKLRAVR
jgi:predicted nucleotide-binding protein (sugar kinase/HSP70/actin superfamily)